MRMLRHSVILAALACACGSAQAQLDEDFEGASIQTTFQYFHSGGGFFEDSGPFDTGLTDEFAYAGTNASLTLSAGANPGSGLGGSIGAFLFVGAYDPSTAPVREDPFYFAGLGMNTNSPVPGTDPTRLECYAYVRATPGVAFQLRVENPYNGAVRAWAFDGVGDGTWQRVGGKLSTATIIGAVSYSDPVSVIVAFNGPTLSLGDTLEVDEMLLFGPQPVFVESLQSLYAADGEAIQFRARADFADTFQWYLNGAALTDGPVFSGTQTDTISFNASAATEGVWRCEATNINGTTTSNNAVLAVRPPDNPCLADINGDGIVDNGDIGAFVAIFLAGCP